MARYQYKEENSGKHIDDIVGRTVCDKHHGHKGVACFYVFWSTGDGEPKEAICDARIKAAGFNGTINPSSLRQKNRDGTINKRF